MSLNLQPWLPPNKSRFCIPQKKFRTSTIFPPTPNQWKLNSTKINGKTRHLWSEFGTHLIISLRNVSLNPTQQLSQVQEARFKSQTPLNPLRIPFSLLVLKSLRLSAAKIYVNVWYKWKTRLSNKRLGEKNIAKNNLTEQPLNNQ